MYRSLGCRWQTNAHGDGCNDCDVGKFNCRNAGTCVASSPGYFVPGRGAVSQQPCPGGQYGSTPGLKNCGRWYVVITAGGWLPREHQTRHTSSTFASVCHALTVSTTDVCVRGCIAVQSDGTATRGRPSVRSVSTPGRNPQRTNQAVNRVQLARTTTTRPWDRTADLVALAPLRTMTVSAPRP